MKNTGEYGGVVKRAIKNAGGKAFVAGAILTPADVESWPVANRIALHNSGYIDWYGPPVAAEQEAREAGKPAVARPKRVKAETPAVAKTNPARRAR
jgi:hypothetical protein